MPPDDFEVELHELLARAKAERMPFEELEPYVQGLHRKHGREILPPITGTLKATDPQDRFGRK